MNTQRLIASQTSDSAPRTEAPLQVVITSDHPTLARSAATMVDDFLRNWAPEVDSHRDDWTFSELENPAFAREALELAYTCDILVVAVSGYEDLPSYYVKWIKEWIRTRASKETAIILCAPAGAKMYLLPRFAALPDLLRGNGFTCFTTALHIPRAELPSAVQPKSLLARMASEDWQNLPENSCLNE